MPVFIVPHPEAIEALKHESWFRDHMQRTGNVVAALARNVAPRSHIHHSPPIGHGADSIHCVTESNVDGWHAKVGWDEPHSYMRYTRSHAIQEATFAVVGR